MSTDVTSPMQLLTPGAIIGGRYEVIRTVGHGGMGAVLQVVDRALEGEIVALKLLYPHLAMDKTSFARFRNEVLIARRLSHPNIVRLYDIGNAGGGYYFISMEFVDGGNLTKLIYEHRHDLLSFKETLRILRDIALAMAHAHGHGVIHRDLKPDNVLMGDNNGVKVTDFGLARNLFIDKGFTDSGEAVGTPYYMAPEQLRGERCDGRCDIYALGLIAFEMVVGRRPFFDESYLQLAALHFNEPIPDFATKESGIPKWYEDFVKRCAAKKPDDRFQSAEEVAEYLTEQLDNLSGKQTKLRKRPAIMSFYAHTQRKKAFRAGSVVTFSLIFGVALAFLCRTVAADPRLLGPILALKNIILPQDPTQLVEKIKSGDAKGVELLLASHVDPNTPGGDGVLPLFVALGTKQFDIALKLVDAGAKVNVRDAKNATPLMLAVEDPRAIQVVSALLANGANTDMRDASFRTPLMIAAQSGNLSAAQALVDHNAVLNAADIDGKTALFYAAALSSTELTELLIRNHADPSVQDSSKKTALESPATSVANRKYLKSLGK